MSWVQENIAALRKDLPEHVTLVCVSKFHPATLIEQAYDAGERDFGESRVQELVEKQREMAANSALSDETAQRIASEIIEQLTEKKKAELSKKEKVENE